MGKRGRGAAGKTPVFGLLKRGDVFISIVPNCSREALMQSFRGKYLRVQGLIPMLRKAYDGLVVNGYDHYRVFRRHFVSRKDNSITPCAENFTQHDIFFLFF
jgi:transposase-like protein